MIIKSMARKSPSFNQLIQYFHKDAFYRKAPTYAHNMWDTHSPEAAAAEFDQNATFLPKRANGNYLYHECLVLTERPSYGEMELMSVSDIVHMDDDEVLLLHSNKRPVRMKVTPYYR